jgi:type IV pilus assembly protein PilB
MESQVIRDAQHLGNILVQEGKISLAQLEAALGEQEDTRERLGEILTRQGLIQEADLFLALSSQLGCGRFDPTRHLVENPALELVPLEFARRHAILPVQLGDEDLTVAMADPLDLETRDYLKRIAARHGRGLKILLGQREDLDRIREASFVGIEGNRQVTRIIDRVVDETRVSLSGNRETAEMEGKAQAEEAAVVELVKEIIDQALLERATDIHIEPHAEKVAIRYRVDGLLNDALTLPQAVSTGTVSRIKILANMDIAERRMAQDGRFSHRSDRQDVDIRVSAIPTIHGEKLVLRLLDKSNFSFTLQDLGFSAEDYAAFRKAIHQPHGLILLSGPTGSGKTTTLYSSLLELRNETTNITTVEDPVEYQIDRINQVQVNTRKGVTFANALRSFLRQDPDVIMVGEVRDGETADIAVRAALTGHLVFSTIHANDAPATVTRLISMGCEPFMAASALSLVAAQRLVRRNCPHCLEEYRPSAETLLAVGLTASGADFDGRFVRGTGCAACRGRGFDGRLAVIERMTLNPGLRQLVAQGRPASDIRLLAMEQGMNSLRQSGLNKVKEGRTTVEEVLRICASDE